MNEAPPLAFTWDGEAMAPVHPRLADKYFVVGERYMLEEWHERSRRSHDHFFACVAEAHANLPDDLAIEYPTPDHLRKRALIWTGFRDERSIACSSKAEALRVAAFVGQMDDFAVVVVREAVVIAYTAKTQKKRAMGAKDFQRSKDAVLDWIAKLIGTSKDALEKCGSEAA